MSSAFACSGDPPDFDALWSASTSRVHTPTTRTQGVDGREVIHQRPHLMDGHGRYLHIRGINVSGSHKAPPTEAFPSRYPLPDDPALAERCQRVPLAEACVPSRDVSYVGRPFPLDEADRWFGELAGLGFNAVRLITNWESIQPYRPGTCGGRGSRYSPECFDLEYLDYYDALISKAQDHGIYVLVDMHQDMFSRHLMAYYNEDPTFGSPADPQRPAPGSLDAIVLSLIPPYSDWVRGHGAPRWVVETCLPEKNLDSPYWGMFRGLGQLTNPDGSLNAQLIFSLQALLGRLAPGGAGVPPWFGDFLAARPSQRFEPNETSDFLPLTPWVVAGGISLDVDRCFAAFFAGDKVFPDRVVDTDGRTKRRDEVANPDALPDLRTYLQDRYTDAYLQIVERARRHENVIGYDLMNEPVGVFLMLAVGGLFAQLAATSDDPDTVDRGPIEQLLTDLLGEGLGGDLFGVINGLALLPTDGRPETLRLWGLDGIDVGAALDLNFAFDAHYLQPFFERLGAAVEAADQNAIIWFEPGSSLRTVTGPQQFWDTPLTRPQGITQLVFAPHWYPDIYPNLGLDSPPRDFNPEEWLYRDFAEPLRAHIAQSPGWLGNVPVVFGEFGTYFNFGGIDAAEASGYALSAHILNRYYEAFESLNTGNMVWCFSAENDRDYGDLWNHEDFSIIGPDGQARGWPAYVRPHARATSGKLIGQQFISQYHFWDPEKGTPRPDRRYTLQMAARESDAPTEVFVPRRQYPDGFYVWLSDGEAFFDAARQVLYWYPSRNEVGTSHALRIDPRFTDREALGWSYYFEGDRVVIGVGDRASTGGR
ncbi:MAG: cellulase family glycosylhydrolase [Myxococcales bacterium]|nr:cellulase family glycosylhydrolase [Myxococcales bacterium]